MRRGNFFRRNQYKIAAVCVLAAVLGLTGMYMLRERESKEEKQRIAAEESEQAKSQTVAKAQKEETEKAKEKTAKKEEKKTEEKDTEQTARVSAVVKPKQAEVKKDTQAKAAGQKNTEQEAGQAGQTEQADQTGQTEQPDQAGQAEQTGQAGQTEQQEQSEQKKTAETGKTKAAVPAELHFDKANGLLWPLDGAVILDYSMDKTVYFTTLDQYKYNPAIIISGNVNDKVKAAANGKITDISSNEVTGCTVTMDIGDGYAAIYGQLREVPYKTGAYLEAGDSLGFVSEPTKYYSLEGSNLYFALEKDGIPVDPVEFFVNDLEE